MSSRYTEERKRFAALVSKAETDLSNDPISYKRKLIYLAGLGYGYLFGVVVLLLLLVGFSVWIALQSGALFILLLKTKLIFLLLGVLYIIFRALWVRLPEPTGFTLLTENHPHLYAQISQLCQKLQAPKIHSVVLTPELNAAIQQRPRLGVFGWQKNTLILGVQLLMTLPEEEVLAVIGHELGHLSGNHSRFNGWIYRVRQTWASVMQAFNQANYWSRLIFGKFFNWYVPYFNAYSFALARSNEFEADAAATQVTSEAALVNALLRVSTNAEKTASDYWQGLIKKADFQADIELKPYTSMLAFAQEHQPNQANYLAAIEKLMLIETGDIDTHPAIKDRIAPYAKSQRGHPLLPPFTVSAADAFLQSNLTSLLTALDDDWVANNNEDWEERFLYAENERIELIQLEATVAADRTVEEWFMLARKTEEFLPDIQPQALYRKALELDGNHIGANYALGRLLLAEQDVSGIDYLERSMQQHQLVAPACELIYQHWQQHGQVEKAEVYLKKAEAQQELYDHAQREREKVSRKDQFKRPSISKSTQLELSEKLKSLTMLKHVWLAEKVMHHYPEEKVLVFVFVGKILSRNRQKLIQQMQSVVDIDTDYWILDKKGSHSSVAKKALKVAVQLI